MELSSTLNNLKKSMKKLILILLLACNIHANAQDDKTVTLVVSGQGKTQDEAKQNALRSAIEQAFGTFISSKTEILNDNLVKDEIVSVSNGNIKKFEIISEVQIPNGVYATSLKATVSVSKLTSFVESKGFSVELKGGLFAFNIEQQKLMEQNEHKCIENFIKSYGSITKNCLEYKILKNGEFTNSGGDNWKIPLIVEAYFNENIKIIKDNLFLLLKSLSLSTEMALDYQKLKVNIYPVCISISKDNQDYFVLRSIKSNELLTVFLKNLFQLNNFCIYTDQNPNCIYIPNQTENRFSGIYNIFAYTEIKDYQILQRNFLRNSFDVGGFVPSVFSTPHLKFIKKLKRKMIYSKSPYTTMAMFDLVKIGHVYSLEQAIPNKLFYKFYFDDSKSLKDIKNVNKYLVKLK